MSALRSVPPPSTDDRWMSMQVGFGACHRSAANLWMHAFTTPLGMIGVFALMAAVSPVVPAIAAIWLSVWLLERLPWRLTALTALLLAGMVVVAVVLPWTPWTALAAVVVGFAAQEAAHWLTDEPTFQSTYQGQRGWLGQLVEHAVFLLPLIVDAMVRHGSLFALFVPTDRVAHGTLVGSGSLSDLEVLRGWVRSQDGLPEDRTTHWWARELPEGVREAFERLEDSEEVKGIIQERFGEGYTIAPVHRMNEVYVAAERPELTSDTVFYMSHIDGPLAVFPMSSVFRCMVAVTPNHRIATHFPMHSADYSEPRSVVLDTADVLAFDFNRELHYISEEDAGPRLSEQDGRRVTLKLHFAIVPRSLRGWGWLHGQLTGRYNEIARQVFLDTIAPSSWRERAGALWVLATTRSFELIQRWIGATNLAYVAAAGALSVMVGSLSLFVALTGFVHYGLYIATFAHRRDVAYGTFLRDSVFFKAVSMGSLAVVAALNFTAEPVAIVLMIAGFGTAGLAAAALGKERTYFGVELGRCAPRRVTRFPYGVIPHPMILGAIIGLLGIHALGGFRAALPWVVPVHVALYLVHLIQEQVDHQQRKGTILVVS
jgi:hypothetical protein